MLTEGNRDLFRDSQALSQRTGHERCQTNSPGQPDPLFTQRAGTTGEVALPACPATRSPRASIGILPLSALPISLFFVRVGIVCPLRIGLRSASLCFIEATEPYQFITLLQGNTFRLLGLTVSGFELIAYWERLYMPPAPKSSTPYG